MKISDTTLKQDSGGIWICRRKSSGSVKDTERINVTEEVIGMFCDLCKTDANKAKLYNRNGKAYKIQVQELSSEEVDSINEANIRKGGKALANLMGVYTAFLADNPRAEQMMKIGKKEGFI